ncbi:DUF397 domain-containing protein [Streptomyces sp. H39-S7]|uniref:DUF397 domain-containing protein n=1 Tax=Streptomyces sp. H39-S7 TaxID=3004357 RepID=UPI0022AEF2A2|nr:DUF397 domain-containing protein [Streptomyces sp. H39-S7]MCZ4126000.1 DUF397 domain-containing protein [Streptomyces sp. H39-S7]
MRAPIVWQKSSFSGPDEGQSCVELAPRAGAVLLRESDDPDVIVRTTPTALRAFLQAIRDGLFDAVR